MNERERLRALVDALPDNEVHTALRFVEFLLSPAPPEPEAEDAGHGRIISHEGMRKRVFGKD
jgi:hypothetical protein